METKTGRERKLNYGAHADAAAGEAAWLTGFLREAGERMLDQVDHLPPSALNAAPSGSYLTPARVVLHCVGAELRLLRLVEPAFSDPPYVGLVAKTTSEDFATMETDKVDAVQFLRTHLEFRRGLLSAIAAAPGRLDEALNHPHFADKRAVLGHLVWHWSFHSGHIGAVTLELGYEYSWTSERRGPGADITQR